MRYLQLISHKLVGMLAVCLSKILMELNTVTDCQHCVGSIYSKKCDI